MSIQVRIFGMAVLPIKHVGAFKYVYKGKNKCRGAWGGGGQLGIFKGRGVRAARLS